MPPRQRTMLPRARPEAIHCSPSALASLSLLFLEDLARRLSGHPLSDKYQTPTLVLFYVLRLYQAVLFNCFLRPICWPSCVLYPTTFLIQVVFFLSYLTYQNEGVTVFLSPIVAVLILKYSTQTLQTNFTKLYSTTSLSRSSPSLIQPFILGTYLNHLGLLFG
jgi:hypothetical protein